MNFNNNETKSSTKKTYDYMFGLEKRKKGTEINVLVLFSFKVSLYTRYFMYVDKSLQIIIIKYHKK